MHVHEHDDHHDHTDPTQNWLRVGILAGLGVYFAYNIVSGNLANYINVRFMWLSYVATGLFLVLAVTSLLQLFRQDEDVCGDVGCTCHHDGHDHEHGTTWAVLVTVALPLLMGVMIPSQPLGANAVNGSIRTSAVNSANSSGFAIAPEQRNVLDWLREFNASDDHATINGQRANVIGFVYKEPDYPDGYFMVARFTVSCCVADASAIALPVQYSDAGQLEQGAWVRVSGSVEVRDFQGDTAPVIREATVNAVDTPEHPYLYP